MTKAQALLGLKRGSQEALEWFIDHYTPYVSTIIYNIIGKNMTRSDIEEVASDVFFALWQNADKVKLSSVKSYLGAIARNKAKNKLRSAGYELTLEEDLLVVDMDGLETRLLEEELKLEVRKAALSMKEPERELLLRYYYYCQSIEDISAQMGLNPSTVKTKLRRARLALKTSLTELIT